jgi:hypothetical protein
MVAKLTRLLQSVSFQGLFADCPNVPPSVEAEGMLSPSSRRQLLQVA